MDMQEAGLNYIVEVEYMSATSCCAQLLWIKNQLEDDNVYESKIPIFCDNRAVISLLKNPILHSKAKHIEIKHHFIRDHVQNGTVDLQFVPTDDQLVDILTKPLTKERLILLRSQLGMIFVNDWLNFYMSSTSASKDMLTTGPYHTLTTFNIWMTYHAFYSNT